MNTILLIYSIAITNQVAQLRFKTPGPGSYSVQRAVSCTDDPKDWKVIASGYVRGAVHVGAHERALPCAFYRVEWRKDTFR
jgi:hypothetical protein